MIILVKLMSGEISLGKKIDDSIELPFKITEVFRIIYKTIGTNVQVNLVSYLTPFKSSCDLILNKYNTITYITEDEITDELLKIYIRATSGLVMPTSSIIAPGRA